MKKVEAIIRHTKVDDLLEKFDQIGIVGVTITEVKGAGKQKGYTEVYRGASRQIRVLPKVKIESVIEDSQVAIAIAAIREIAYTGEVGDGKIFVIPVENSIRIRTGEESISALK